MQHTSAICVVELVNYGKILALGGREKADIALVLTARRLGEVARDIDTAARISDTMFALALEGPITEKEVATIGAALIARGLRPQLGLPDQDTLDFMIMGVLVDTDAVPVKKIVRHLVARISECDVAATKRVYFTSLPASNSSPAALTEDAEVEVS